MLGRHPGRAALACAMGLALLYGVAVLPNAGQLADEEVLEWIQRLGVGPLHSWWPLLARRVLPVVLLVLVTVLAVRRLWSGHVRRVVAAALVVGLSTGASMLLKATLIRPEHGRDYGYLGNTFPSTHVSATVALVVALWLLMAPGPRWAGWVLAAVVWFVVLGNVVGHAHRPSDALGSVLLVGFVVGLLTTLGRVTGGRRPSARPRHGRRGSAPR